MYLQQVHQTLRQHGLKAPVMHHVCADKSVLGGVFAVMELVPGQTVFGLAPELHAKALGESMATMHELDVRPIVESFRQAGVPDERFWTLLFVKKHWVFLKKRLPGLLTWWLGCGIICPLMVRIFL